MPCTVQFAAEQPADSPRRTINGGKQIRIAFLYSHAPERQYLRADSALRFRGALGAYPHRDLSHPPAITAQSKT